MPSYANAVKLAALVIREQAGKEQDNPEMHNLARVYDSLGSLLDSITPEMVTAVYAAAMQPYPTRDRQLLHRAHDLITQLLRGPVQ